MHVTLAHPFDGHDVGDTIEVSADLGRDLLHDGYARLPDLGGRTKAELEELARAEGVPVPAGARKADVVGALEARYQAGQAGPMGLGPTDEGVTDGR